MGKVPQQCVETREQMVQASAARGASSPTLAGTRFALLNDRSFMQ